MVQGVRNFPSVRLTNPARMADFVTWCVACGLNDFENRYQQSLLDNSLALLEDDGLAGGIKALMERREQPWEGIAAELAQELQESGYQAPENPRALSVEVQEDRARIAYRPWDRGRFPETQKRPTANTNLKISVTIVTCVTSRRRQMTQATHCSEQRTQSKFVTNDDFMTEPTNAHGILGDGFRDEEGSYMLEDFTLRGVFLSGSTY